MIVVLFDLNHDARIFFQTLLCLKWGVKKKPIALFVVVLIVPGILVVPLPACRKGLYQGPYGVKEG